MTPELKAAAAQIVYQWDNHDRHRVTAPVLMVGEFGEPTDVAIARAYLSLAPRLAEMERKAAAYDTILTVVRPKRERESDAGWMDWVVPTARCDSFEEAIDHRATKELAEMQHRVGMELKAERAATRTGETVE